MSRQRKARAWGVEWARTSDSSWACLSALRDTGCAIGTGMVKVLIVQKGHRKPTVSLGVTSLVADTYGCDDGRIALTRCALIAGGLGDRCSQRQACKTPPAGARSAHSALVAGAVPV